MSATAGSRRTRRCRDTSGRRALVVDDIPENREVLALMLTLIGCEVVLAENGRQAVEVVRVSRPQIVFMDMRMPEFDGIEATRRIIAEFGAEQVKIVATSASALTHERAQCLKAGCDDFVAKPFRAERIYGLASRPLRYEALSAIMFLQPEVASCGINEQTARERQIAHRVGVVQNRLVARNVAMRATVGFIKLVVSDEKPHQAADAGRRPGRYVRCRCRQA